MRNKTRFMINFVVHHNTLFLNIFMFYSLHIIVCSQQFSRVLWKIAKPLMFSLVVWNPRTEYNIFLIIKIQICAPIDLLRLCIVNAKVRDAWGYKWTQRWCWGSGCHQQAVKLYKLCLKKVFVFIALECCTRLSPQCNHAAGVYLSTNNPIFYITTSEFCWYSLHWWCYHSFHLNRLAFRFAYKSWWSVCRAKLYIKNRWGAMLALPGLWAF